MGYALHTPPLPTLDEYAQKKGFKPRALKRELVRLGYLYSNGSSFRVRDRLSKFFKEHRLPFRRVPRVRLYITPAGRSLLGRLIREGVVGTRGRPAVSGTPAS